jgi:hypothetical protein
MIAARSISQVVLRLILVAALTIVIYVPVFLLVERGNERNAYIYAAIFPVAWLILMVTAFLTSRTARGFSAVAVVAGTICLVAYYALPRVAQ